VALRPNRSKREKERNHRGAETQHSLRPNGKSKRERHEGHKDTKRRKRIRAQKKTLFFGACADFGLRKFYENLAKKRRTRKLLLAEGLRTWTADNFAGDSQC